MAVGRAVAVWAVAVSAAVVWAAAVQAAAAGRCHNDAEIGRRAQAIALPELGERRLILPM